jgi:transcriptional regulator GlxA family with amidase domain
MGRRSVASAHNGRNRPHLFIAAETLCRAFARRVGVSPSEYRDRFRPSQLTASEEMTMDIALLVFPRLTALDAIGPYEVLQRLPGAQVRFVGAERGAVRTEQGMLGLVADFAMGEVTSADILVVPGGIGTRQLVADEATLEWIRAIDAGSTWTTSVCTGSLLLGAAGLLQGKRATTHWAALDLLRGFGATPVSERVVEQGKIITAAGVSSGIDMALRLAAHVAGDDIARAIQLGIEYDPQPPFDSGSVAKATETVRNLALSGLRQEAAR